MNCVCFCKLQKKGVSWRRWGGHPYAARRLAGTATRPVLMTLTPTCNLGVCWRGQAGRTE